jgi:16S rRNA (cytosine967-C5)-methyltransferase
MELAQRIAANAVQRVLAGATLPAALAQCAAAAGAERPLVHELAYGTLRYLGQLRTASAILADRPFVDANVETLICVALYQLIHTSAPPHAVVDNAVRAMTRIGRTSAKGLTNAILRSFIRRRDALLADVSRVPEGRFSYPRWWIDRVHAEYPTDAAAILDAGNTRPPLALRVNRRAIDPDAYIRELTAGGEMAERVGDAGLIVARPRAVTELPGFDRGWFSVQDAGAQLAAPLLDARDGMRVLDACAAPGGKTTHIAELWDTDLTAIDADAVRLQRVEENLRRLNLRSRVVHADAANPNAWWDGVPFDRILVDAPCTASGIVRRHPDGKWLRREADVGVFAVQQARLLDALWPLLARGGAMLYVTCSIFRAENQGRVAAFVAERPDAETFPVALPPGSVDGQLLPSGPGAAHNHDGFFFALLHKN